MSGKKQALFLPKPLTVLYQKRTKLLKNCERGVAGTNDYHVTGYSNLMHLPLRSALTVLLWAHTSSVYR